MSNFYNILKKTFLSLFGLIILISSGYGQLSAPADLTVRAMDVERVMLNWTGVPGASGYKVLTSVDSVTFTEVLDVTDTIIIVANLMEGTDYDFLVTAYDGSGNGDAAVVEAITVTRKMELHFPLDATLGDTAITEAIYQDTLNFEGELSVMEAEETGIGVGAIKFVQDELAGINSYVPLTASIQKSTLGEPLMGRTISFWLKNESPSQYSVPISFGKRTGMAIAFKNDSIWAFTEQRVGDWYADGVGTAWGKDTNWTHIAYVYNEPNTELYIDGMLAASVETKSAWPYPAKWLFGGDKSYEIGAQVDPSVATVKFFNDTFDPGARNYFNGSLADLKLYNYAMSAGQIKAMVLPEAPASLEVKALGANDMVIKWSDVSGESSYRIEYSTDSITWTENKIVDADVSISTISGLNEETEYFIKVTPVSAMGDGNAVTLKAATIKKLMLVDIPFNELVGDSAIENRIDGSLDDMLYGQIEIVDSAASGLGKPAIKFVQDELGGINSYVRLYNTILPVTGSLTGRTISFWVKNNQPELWSVPISIEKRTGMGIAFKDGIIHAVTKHRLNSNGIDWVADSIGAPFKTNEWAMVTYVFDNPVTKLYINGQKAGESDGVYIANTGAELELPYPTFIQLQAGGDKSGEIGALLDPDAGMVQYLGDTWDPGARHYFDGMMGQLKMYNYALDDSEISSLYSELAVSVTGLMVQAKAPTSIQLRWDDAEGETGYKLEKSDDGETFTNVATTEANVMSYLVKGLMAATKYWLRVTPVAEGLTGSATVADSTYTGEMIVHFDFAELVGDTALENVVDGTLDDQISGQIDLSSVQDTVTINDSIFVFAGINKVTFTQDELSGINSYIRLYNTILPVSESLNERTVAFWVKNDNPGAYSVPISFEKRTGFSIAFTEDNMIHAFTKHRISTGGVDWVADSTGAVYDRGNEWTHIAYVFDSPVTRLYINGELADESDGVYVTNNGNMIDLPFATFIQVQNVGDKSAEIGAQLDPDAATVAYLNDTWDPGPRNYFTGSLADLQMYNYALSNEEIGNIRNSALNFLHLTGIGDNTLSNIKVYPNPATDILHIQGVQKCTVSVIDYTGKTLLQMNLNGENQINIGHLPEGLYFLKIESESIKSITRFTKMK